MGLVNEPATVWITGGEHSPDALVLFSEDSQSLLTETSIELTTEDTFIDMPVTAWAIDSTPPATVWVTTTEAVPATAWSNNDGS